MAYSKEDWDIVRAWYERGFSLSEIVSQDNVKIKSRGSISKRAAAEGWVQGEKKHIVTKEVQAKQDLDEVRKQKETMSVSELSVHEQAVAQQLKDRLFFHGGHKEIAERAIQKVRKERDVSFGDLDAASRVFARAQDSVLGKEPTTVINNTNAQQTVTQLPSVDVYADVARKLLDVV